MSNRIQMKTSQTSRQPSTAFKADILLEYAPVRELASVSLQQAAQLSSKMIGFEAAAVCWVSSNTVRLMATYGLGNNRLARSLPKDFTWFAPPKPMHSSESGVLRQVESFLGIEHFQTMVSIPLMSHSGLVMGSLLLLDRSNQQPEAAQLELLAGVADLAMDGINAVLLSTKRTPQDNASELENAVMQAKESVVACDLAGIITAWNDGAEEMYGYEREKMIGQPLTTIIPSLEQANFLHLLEQLPQKNVAPREVTRLHQSGFRIQVRSSIEAIRDGQGTVIGILEFSGISTDPVRSAQTDHFQSLMKHLPMIFVQTDARGMITFIEGQLLEQENLKSQALLGLSIHELWTNQSEIARALQGEKLNFQVPWQQRTLEIWAVPIRQHERLIGCHLLAVDISQQVKSEQALEVVSHRVEQLLETLPILVLSIDKNGCLTMLEGLGVKHFGGAQAAGRLIGVPLNQILRDDPVVENLIESALAGEEFQVSFDFRGMDVQVFVRPIYQDDVLVGANAIVIDTSANNQTTLEKNQALRQLLDTQTTLAQQQAFAQLVLETIDQGVTVNNEHGIFEYVSPAYAKMLGYEPEELIGQSPVDLVIGKKQELRATLEERNQGWRSVNRYDMEHKDGSIIKVEVIGYPRYSLNGEIKGGGVALTRDVTRESEHAKEVAQIKTQLEQERDYALDITNGLQVGLVLINQERKIEYMNPAFTKTVGYELEDLIGKTTLELVHPDDHRLLNEAQQLRQAGQYSVYRYRVKHKDGHWITIEGHTSPRIDATGQPIGAIATLHDVTEQVQLEQAAHAARRALERETKTKLEKTQALLLAEQKYRQLFEDSQAQAKRLELIDTIRNAASSTNTTQNLIQNIVTSISQTLGVPMVSIYLLEGGQLVLQHAVGYENTIQSHAMTGKGVMVRSVKGKQVMLITDSSTDPDFVHLSGSIKSELCVPITNQDEVLGVINLESLELAAFNEADANLLLQIAERISHEIQITRLLDEMRLLEAQNQKMRQRNTETKTMILPNIEAGIAFIRGIGGEQYFTAHLEKHSDWAEKKLILRGRSMMVVILEGTLKQYLEAIKVG